MRGRVQWEQYPEEGEEEKDDADYDRAHGRRCASNCDVLPERWVSSEMKAEAMDEWAEAQVQEEVVVEVEVEVKTQVEAKFERDTTSPGSGAAHTCRIVRKASHGHRHGGISRRERGTVMPCAMRLCSAAEATARERKVTKPNKVQLGLRRATQGHDLSVWGDAPSVAFFRVALRPETHKSQIHICISTNFHTDTKERKSEERDRDSTSRIRALK
jgi:hypothetical protein